MCEEDFNDPRNVSYVRENLCASCVRAEMCDDKRMRAIVHWDGKKWLCDCRGVLKDQAAASRKPRSGRFGF